MTTRDETDAQRAMRLMEEDAQQALNNAVTLSELSGLCFYAHGASIIVRDPEKLIAMLERLRRNDRLCNIVLGREP